MCDMGVVQFSFAGSKILFLLFGFWCGSFFFLFFFFPFNHHRDYFSVRPVLPISPDARDTLLICTSWSGVNYSTVLERCRGHLERCGRLMQLCDWLQIDLLLSVVNIKIISDLTHGRAAGNINFKKMFSVFEADSSWVYCFYGIISLQTLLIEVAVCNFIQVYQNVKAFPSGYSCQIKNSQAPNLILIFLLATVYYIFFANCNCQGEEERLFSKTNSPKVVCVSPLLQTLFNFNTS